jgi:hypothetical protein
MKQGQEAFRYYSGHESKSFPDQKQSITYSYNDIENTIIGIVEEKQGLIFLYEYRGKYVGTEFFISFSRDSVTYKLINVTDASIPV